MEQRLKSSLKQRIELKLSATLDDQERQRADRGWGDGGFICPMEFGCILMIRGVSNGEQHTGKNNISCMSKNIQMR